MRRWIIGVPAAVAAIATLAGAFRMQGEPAAKPTTPLPAAEKHTDPFSCGTGPMQQLKDLAWMAGEWNVAVTWFAPDGKAYPAKTESTIEPVLNGCFLQERITVPYMKMRNRMIGIRSFDRFRKVFRFVWLDDVVTLADVFEGPATDDGFSVSDVKLGTSSVFDGRETFLRFAQKAGASRDAFSLVWEASTDKGESWHKTCEYQYKRKG